MRQRALLIGDRVLLPGHRVRLIPDREAKIGGRAPTELWDFCDAFYKHANPTDFAAFAPFAQQNVFAPIVSPKQNSETSSRPPASDFRHRQASCAEPRDPLPLRNSECALSACWFH